MTNWTPKQQNVIDTRNRNILVSAAAGSGKTAVLVERIIRMITDEKSPVDIDQLLVVTFTRAAAAEMKERVREALEELVETNPDDINARRQLSLLHNASISTIDSFCAKVVRENFHKIDMDPNYRIADEIEIDLIKTDLLEEILEERYQGKDEDFIALAEKYSNGKLNDNISDLVKALFDKAEGYENPIEWLNKCKEFYEIDSVDHLLKKEWFIDCIEKVKDKLRYHKKAIEDIVPMSESEDGPKFADHIDNFLDTINEFLNQSTFGDMKRVVSNFNMIRQLRGVNKCNPQKNKYCQAVLNSAKNYIQGELQNVIFSKNSEDLYAEIVECKNIVNTIVDLTMEFASRLAIVKKEKGIMDFSDQAQAALKILRNEDISNSISKQYREIMIDEYQDSNYIQEAILSSITNGFGINNMFMVGDVKQSIYRFRKAEPKLFLNKYNLYSEDLKSDNCKIILDKNFRSREEVINSVNYIFNHIMQKSVGGIDYTAGNQLVAGADYPDLPLDQNNNTEIIAVQGDVKDVEIEYVAQKIKEITDPVNGMKVTDKSGNLRPIKYSDIAILLRSVKTNAQLYVEHLENNGIPATAEMKTGYYEAMEINTIMCMLQVIDNPRQDISLATVLVSTMFNFDSNELAIIKNEVLGDCLYQRIENYDIDGTNVQLKLKIRHFLNTLNKFRVNRYYLSVYELINVILEETKFDYYIMAMPNGKRRQLNIEALKEKAVAYDQTSYKGLFNFVRYIEKIKLLAKDEGEVSVSGAEDNAVKIMTIHKSKGLQFPVVFVCNTNSSGKDDSIDKILVTDEGFIGVDSIDAKLHNKNKTFIKQYIANELLKEQKAEDLRLLYVALTRAQEKLIVTGKISKLEEELNALKNYQYQSEDFMSYGELTDKNTFWYWISRTVSKNKAFDLGLGEYENPNNSDELYKLDANISFKVITEDEVVENVIESQDEEQLRKEMLASLKNYEISDKEVSSILKSNFDFVYPYLAEINLPTKASVTEIKKQSMSYIEELDGHNLFNDENMPIENIPTFAKDNIKDTSLKGAERGTAYHRVFELLDFSKESYSYDDISSSIDNWVIEGLLSKNQADCISIKDVISFTNSSLYKRMHNAHLKGDLFREQKFLLSKQIRDIYQDFDGDEPMIMQGIIDVCFIEDGKYVIADYKTDRVSTLQELVDRYKIQLECYKIAIEQIAKIDVSELIIYSVTLNDVVSI